MPKSQKFFATVEAANLCCEQVWFFMANRPDLTGDENADVRSCRPPTHGADVIAELFTGQQTTLTAVYESRASFIYKPRSFVMSMRMPAHQAVSLCCLASVSEGKTIGVEVLCCNSAGAMNALLEWLPALVGFDLMRDVTWRDWMEDVPCKVLKQIATGMQSDTTRFMTTFRFGTGQGNDFQSMADWVNVELARKMGFCGFVANATVEDWSVDDDFGFAKPYDDFKESSEFTETLEYLLGILPFQPRMKKEERIDALAPVNAMLEKMRLGVLTKKFTAMAAAAERALPFFEKLEELRENFGPTQTPFTHLSLVEFVRELQQFSVQSFTSSSVAAKNWVGFIKTQLTGSAVGLYVEPRYAKPKWAKLATHVENVCCTDAVCVS